MGLALLGCVGEAHAHALAQRYDLPLPLGFFLLAAGTVVAVSFVLVALFWRRQARKISTAALHGTLPGIVVACCQLFGIGVLALVIAAGLFGNQGVFKNIAPVAVWVIWWVGLSFVSAFVGNIWALINPWSALFDLVERLARPWARSLSLRLPYPPRLAAWPAVFLFLLFAWLELVAPARDVPRNIAVAAAFYSVFTWTGFVLFGRQVWLAGGEVFSVAFELLARFAPLHFSRRPPPTRWRWTLRPYAAGLLPKKPFASAMMAFTLLMLGTVTVDGIMETPLWVAFVEQFGSASAAFHMALMSALLIAGPLALASLYLGTIAVMARMTRAPSLPSPACGGEPAPDLIGGQGGDVPALAGWFVLALVPIAIAYQLSHYFSLLMIAGQFIIPLASDPFGYGWDLFGTTLYRIDIGIVDAKLIWYLSVIAIVTGHIVAVCIGHITAFAVFADPVTARRSQYPMLGLMIGYTMLSLWIIAQPIVETSSK